MIAERLRRILTDSAIYGIGGVISKGVIFLLVPVYTRVLSIADYGLLELYITLAAILSSVSLGGQDAALSFFFFRSSRDDTDEKSRLVTTLLFVRTLWGLLVFAATATIYHKIAPAVGLPSDVRILAVICLSIFATQAADQGTDLFRYNFQPALYCVCLGVQTIVSSLISVYLIVFKNAGLIGYFVGVIIGATIVAVGSWIAFSRLVSIKKLNWSYIVKLLRFGLPLVPMSTGFLVLSSLDKWYIFWTWNASEVGKYAVCAKIVGLLTFIVSTFRQAWWPNAMEAIHQPGGETVLKQFASLYVLASVGGVLVLTGAAPVLIELVAPAEYRGSYAIIGVLAWQSVFYGLYLITSIGIWKREKTYCTTLLIGIAILAQAVLLDLFVPAFAGFGAAVSTAGSFFFWNICTLLLSQRLWPVSYDIKKFAAIFAFGAVVSGVTAYGYMSQIVAVSQIFALTAGFALIALCIQRGLALLRKENG